MGDYAELIEMLRLASHDERLSTGALYRRAADALENLAGMIGYVQHKGDCSRHAVPCFCGLGIILDKIKGAL